MNHTLAERLNAENKRLEGINKELLEVVRLAFGLISKIAEHDAEVELSFSSITAILSLKDAADKAIRKASSVASNDESNK